MPQLSGPSQEGKTSLSTKAIFRKLKDLERHTILFRGSTLQRHRKVYNEATGDLDTAFLSTAQGDFSRRPAAYFTPQIETAERYCKFTAHHDPLADLSILILAIPWEVTEKELVTTFLFHEGDAINVSRDWKEVVFHSRQDRKLPKETQKRLEKTDVFIGNIASGPNCRYTALKSWEEITERFLLKVQKRDGSGETKAIQWAFVSEKGLKMLEEVCNGKGVIVELGKKSDLYLST